MKIVMTFAMILGTTALFAQKDVSTDIRTKVQPRPAKITHVNKDMRPAQPVRTQFVNKEMRPVDGVVRVGKADGFVSIVVKHPTGKVSYVPVNLPEALQKDGQRINFNFNETRNGFIKLRNIAAI